MAGKGVSMADHCKMLRLCGFLKNHSRPNDVAGLWVRQEYCTGPKEDECKRKQYMIEHGKVPPDDMSPDGQMVPPADAS
jgi:hypothetical protein